MGTIWEDIRFKVIHSGSRLNRLIGINVAVFLVLGLLGVIEILTTKHAALYNLINSYLVLPSTVQALLPHFWTPITYMFLNEGIFGFIFNMLWFFWMGQIFEEYLGGKKLITLYILGGLVGAAFYIGACAVFPLFNGVTGYATGSAACVVAIIAGTATLLPDHSIFMMFFGEVKLKWVGLVYVLLDVFAIVGPGSAAMFTHLGAALLGFIYVKQLHAGRDWGKSISKMFSRKSNLKVVSNSAVKNVSINPQQNEIDNILDKISKSGYDSLSKQEKETLFRASKDDKS